MSDAQSTEPVVLDLGAKPPKWLADGRGVFFGRAEPKRPRVHWYAKGASESACANYQRPVIGLTSSAAELCPRCVETFTFEGQAVPEMVLPTTPADAEHEYDDEPEGDRDG